MDIKQSPNARAVVTIGKDMTFRDYAQGAYRMRGIGVGQTITLYLIPEVVKRMEAELTAEECARPEVAVPAWLLLNSMRMESLQFVQLSVQELHNIWRKRALGSLTADSRDANALEDAAKEFGGGELATTRLRRFVGSGKAARSPQPQQQQQTTVPTGASGAAAGVGPGNTVVDNSKYTVGCLVWMLFDEDDGTQKEWIGKVSAIDPVTGLLKVIFDDGEVHHHINPNDKAVRSYGSAPTVAEFCELLASASITRWGAYVTTLQTRELQLVAEDARRIAGIGRATDGAALKACCAEMNAQSPTLVQCLATQKGQDLAAEMMALPGTAVALQRGSSAVSVASSGQDTEWLRRCIEEYREPISFTVDDYVPQPETFANKLKALVESRVPFLESAAESERAAVDAVVGKVEQVAAVTAVSDDNKNLNSEVVHENEQ
jgi:hypothetical protein